MTTLLVTHDQDEALDVADRVAVLRAGRIEQVGVPADVYDRPANDFVMSFLGSVSRLGGRLVRPHDIVLGRGVGADQQGEGLWCTVSRVVRLGFEVRVELREADGHELSAQLSRTEVDALHLSEGDVLWARVRAAHTVLGGSAHPSPVLV